MRGLKIEKNRVILYETVVFEVLAPKVFRVRTGGWVTMSTRKAINKGLETFGFDGVRASIKKGVLCINYETGESIPVDGERVCNALK